MIESYEPKATTRRCEKCGEYMVRADCPKYDHSCPIRRAEDCPNGWPVRNLCIVTWCPACEPHKAPGYADRATPDGIFMTPEEQLQAPRIAELEAEVARLKGEVATLTGELTAYRTNAAARHWSAIPEGCALVRLEDLRTGGEG